MHAISPPKILIALVWIFISKAYASESDLRRIEFATDCAAVNLLMSELPDQYVGVRDQLVVVGRMMLSIAAENHLAHFGSMPTNGESLERRNDAAERLLSSYEKNPEDIIRLYYNCDAVRSELGSIGLDDARGMETYIKSFNPNLQSPLDENDQRYMMILQLFQISIDRITELLEENNTSFRDVWDF